MAVNLIPTSIASQQAMPAPSSGRMDLAQMLMAQGGSTAPVNSPMEGFARMLQGIAGGYMAKKEGEQRKDAQKELADALMRSNNVKPWTNPDTGTIAPGTDMSQMQALAQMLSGSDNPVSQQTGMNVQLADIQQQQALAAQKATREAEMADRLALLKAEYGFKPPTTRTVTRGDQTVTEQWNADTGKFEEVASGARFAPPNSGDAPSNVREYEFFRNLPPAEQQRYLTMRRSNPPVNLGDVYAVLDQLNPGQTRGTVGVGIGPERKIGDGQVVTVPAAPGAGRGGPGQPPAAVQPQQQPPVPNAPLPPMAAVPQAQPASATGGAPPPQMQAPSGVSVVDLPLTPEDRASANTAVSDAEHSMKLVDDLVNHPGFSDVVGAPGSISGVATQAFGTPLPGTDAAGFMARLKQIEGKQFLEAFQSLKGGGHITEIEGQKATQAMSRLFQTGQKEEEYLAAAEELKGVLARGLDRAKASLTRGQSPTVTPPNNGGGPSPASDGMMAGAPGAAAAPPRLGPTDKGAFDALPSGARFIAPDGSVRVKP